MLFIQRHCFPFLSQSTTTAVVVACITVDHWDPCVLGAVNTRRKRQYLPKDFTVKVDMTEVERETVAW